MFVTQKVCKIIFNNPTSKYIDLLSNILGVALISKTTHENIGFEKLQQIAFVER